MKRFTAVLAGIALAGLGARADDVKAETKVEGHRNADGTGTVTRTKKHKHGSVTDTVKSEHKVSKDLSGGTTETKEVKADHDAPGMNHDAKTDKKETIKRDKHGNVVKHETTETH